MRMTALHNYTWCYRTVAWWLYKVHIGRRKERGRRICLCMSSSGRVSDEAKAVSVTCNIIANVMKWRNQRFWRKQLDKICSSVLGRRVVFAAGRDWRQFPDTNMREYWASKTSFGLFLHGESAPWCLNFTVVFPLAADPSSYFSPPSQLRDSFESANKIKFCFLSVEIQGNQKVLHISFLYSPDTTISSCCCWKAWENKNSGNVTSSTVDKFRSSSQQTR